MSRVVRRLELDDLAAVAAIDRGLETDRELVVRCHPDRLELVTVRLLQPHRKRFPFDPTAEPWEDGYVAVENGRIRGFIATSMETWNSRLTIRHFYVDREARRCGIGRELMEHAVTNGRAAGAVTAWAETSNRNHPGVQAYARMGFEVCGFDLSLYVGTAAEGEFAVYLSRDLRDDVRGGPHGPA